MYEFHNYYSGTQQGKRDLEPLLLIIIEGPMVYWLCLMLLPKSASRMSIIGLAKYRGNSLVMHRNANNKIVTILVGNKCDMVSKREVSEE